MTYYLSNLRFFIKEQSQYGIQDSYQREKQAPSLILCTFVRCPQCTYIFPFAAENVITVIFTLLPALPWKRCLLRLSVKKSENFRVKRKMQKPFILVVEPFFAISQIN